MIQLFKTRQRACRLPSSAASNVVVEIGVRRFSATVVRDALLNTRDLAVLLGLDEPVHSVPIHEHRRLVRDPRQRVRRREHTNRIPFRDAHWLKQRRAEISASLVRFRPAEPLSDDRIARTVEDDPPIGAAHRHLLDRFAFRTVVVLVVLDDGWPCGEDSCWRLQLDALRHRAVHDG